MISLSTWENYGIKSKEEVGSPRVPEMSSHYLFIQGALNPGVFLGWEDREALLPAVKESAAKVEAKFRSVFPGMQITAIESPSSHEPHNEALRYSAIFGARDKGLVFAGAGVSFGFVRVGDVPNPRYLLGKTDFSAMLSLGNFRERSVDLVRTLWDEINCFDCAFLDDRSLGNSFFLEVENGQPIAGGENLLKKLGLNLEMKKSYIPC